MKENLKKAYLQTAEVFANLSHAEKLKVGAIIVKDDRIISIGFNGTPSGWNNVCEDKEYGVGDEYLLTDDAGTYRLITRPEVIHAESNCISKLAKSAESGKDAVMFITHSPCKECSKLIFQAGITSVYYRTPYRKSDGIEFLQKCGVNVCQLEK